MPVRVRYRLDASVSSSTAEDRDLGNKRYEVVSDGLGEGGTWKTRLAAATVDLEVVLPDVADAKLLVVATNALDPNQTAGTVSLKRNSNTAEEIDIVPLSGTRTGHLLLTTTGITSIYLSNPGTVVMEVILVVAGD
jgi:hypothetical protein